MLNFVAGPLARVGGISVSSRRLSTRRRMADYSLYYFPTPNGKKISMMLEEVGKSYDLKWIHIGKNMQFSDEFVNVNPNSKIPAIVDHTRDDMAIFESGAILEYLAEMHDEKLAGGKDLKQRYYVKEWLYWQMAGFGPMLGQNNFFHVFSKVDDPIGKERYLKESLRLFGVLDKQLSKNKYICGDEFTIADIASYWWSYSPSMSDKIKDQFEGFENVKRWQDRISSRDSVAKVNAIEMPSFD